MVHWYIALSVAGIAFLVSFMAGATDSWPRIPNRSKRKKESLVPADYALSAVLILILISVVNIVWSVANNHGGRVGFITVLMIVLIVAGGLLGRHFPIGPPQA